MMLTSPGCQCPGSCCQRVKFSQHSDWLAALRQAEAPLMIPAAEGAEVRQGGRE